MPQSAAPARFADAVVHLEREIQPTKSASCQAHTGRIQTLLLIELSLGHCDRLRHTEVKSRNLSSAVHRGVTARRPKGRNVAAQVAVH